MKHSKANSNSKANRVILHGECMIIKNVTLPTDAEEELHQGEYVIVAPSEQVGNHHVVDRKPGVKFFKSGGRRFVQTTVKTKIRCLHANRHTAVTIEPGCHEIDAQKEYDPFTARMQKVRD